MNWVLGVLIVSSLLNAAYFLPILYRIWFRRRERPWCEGKVVGRFETQALLLIPTLATAAFALAAGLFAGMPFSPLYWAQMIVSREYLP